MTKAQAFRTEQARNAKPPKAPKPRRPRRDVGVDTADVGTSATDRKALRGVASARSHAGRRGGALLEASVGKPSRKSTRKSSDGTKRTTNLQLKALRKRTAPSARATARR